MDNDHLQLPRSNISFSSKAVQGVSPLWAEKGQVLWLPVEMCGYKSARIFHHESVWSLSLDSSLAHTHF